MSLKDFTAAIDRLGLAGALKLLGSRRTLRRWLPNSTEYLQVRGFTYPFRFRHGTTDKYVIREVLLEDEYQCLLGLADVHTIVDIGANIGAASVLLLNAYPKARLLALEPDPENFAILQSNLAPYGARAIAIRNALWHRSEDLAIERGSFRGGGAWAFQVKSTNGSDAEVSGVTLATLMREHKLESIDILKVDIEGAERYVFDSSITPTLSYVRRIAIELHDQASRDAFLRCVEPIGGKISEHSQTTVWDHDVPPV